MKSFTTLLTLITCVCLLSCEKESIKIDRENTFNTPFKTTVNEGVALRDAQSSVLLEVKNISDERCTSHFDCAESGLATVRVELSNMNNSHAESLLHLGRLGEDNNETDSATIRLDDKWYVVTLLNVNPHPVMGNNEVQTTEILVKHKSE